MHNSQGNLELVTAYYTMKPDPAVPEQRVAFGTSGHRGCAFNPSLATELHLRVMFGYFRSIGIEKTLIYQIEKC